MLKVIIVSLLAWFPVSSQVLPVQPVELQTEEQIPNEILAELFTIASVEWNTTTDLLWNEYKIGDLAVTKIGPDLYRLESVIHGNLDLLLEDDM